jgi:hypothetical protein
MREALGTGTGALSKPSPVVPLGGRLADLLDIQPEDLVVGLGGGSFGPSRARLEWVWLRYKMVIVDASPRRLARLAQLAGVRATEMGPLEFTRYPIQWDRLVLDDLLAADTDVANELLPLLFQRLRPSGRMAAVLATSGLPPSAVLQRSMGMAARLRSAGFEVAIDAGQPVADCHDIVLGVKRAAA